MWWPPLAFLDSIQNSAIRFCTGAFCASPALSHCADSGLAPLHYRRLTLTTTLHEFLFETLCNKPTYREEDTLTYALSWTRPSLKSLSLKCMTPIFPPLPLWSIPLPKILLNLTHLPEKSTNYSIYRAHFHEIPNSFSDSIICYTDGSKMHKRVRFANSINDKIFAYRHRNTASVSIVELQAIFQCLTSILSLPTSHSNSSLIISDSLSALTVISDPYSSHPVVTRILTLLTTFNSSNLTIPFMWVPSQCGIKGNEKVDICMSLQKQQWTIHASIHLYCLTNPTSPFSHAASYIITAPTLAESNPSF